MLKVGVFGVGHLGRFHLNNWKKIPEATIVGFYDPAEEASKEIAGEYNITRFTDPEALADSCDAIDIVVPTTNHFEVCKMAILKSKHVFVEKPMAHNVAEAKEIVKLVREANIKFQVGHVERFNPAFTAAKESIQHPMFIEAHRLSQFNPRGTDVSVILDLMIHDIDIILSIIQSNVKTIMASGVPVLSETPDIATVRIEFDNGCVANLTSSRISMKNMRKMRLFQKDAYISVDFLKKKTEIIKYKTPEDKGVFTFEINTGHGTKTIAIASPQVSETNAILEELKSFTGAILNNQPTVVTELDGYRAIKIAHMILAKINRNQLA